MVTAIQNGFEERGLTGRWEIFFPPAGGDFEVRGEGLRLIVEVNRGFQQRGIFRSMIRLFSSAPVEARLRAWYLNEFVERHFPVADDAVPIVFSILEAHRPSGRAHPTSVTGAPELDLADRPSTGVDD